MTAIRYICVTVAVALALAMPGVSAAADRVAVSRNDAGGVVAPTRGRSFSEDHAGRASRERGSGSLTAQLDIPLTVSASVFYRDVYGNACCDGLVDAPAALPNVTDVWVDIEYHDASDNVIETVGVWAECWVLDAGSPAAAAFASFLDGGYPTVTHCHATAKGIGTGESRVLIDIDFDAKGSDPDGSRWWRYTLTNDNAFTVVGAGASVWETRSPSGTPVFWDTLVPAAAYQQRLAPGEAVSVKYYAFRAPTGSEEQITAYSEALHAPPVDVVYRFYNRNTGTHFYTIDLAERNWVIANLWQLYNYEGAAYYAYRLNEVNTLKLYRFFNKRTGTHFYTADPGERDDVIARLGWLYNYEGQAYAICDSGGLATTPMYRFYNKQTGTHFYTADPVERDEVIANLSWLYNFEGTAFTVPKP